MKTVKFLVILMSLLFISIDLVDRFVTDKQATYKPFSPNDSNLVVNLPQLNKTQIAQLKKAFAEYQQEPVAPVEDIVGLSELQQQQQQGELVEFFNGDFRYRLLAIIFPQGSPQALDKPLALLKVMNIKKPNEPSSIEKIVHGDKFANFTVNITDTQKVDLSLAERHIELLMYQPRA